MCGKPHGNGEGSMITRRSFLGWLGSACLIPLLPRIFSGKSSEKSIKPPGHICPVCGSEDIDIDNGEFRCDNCGAEGYLGVAVRKSW